MVKNLKISEKLIEESEDSSSDESISTITIYSTCPSSISSTFDEITSTPVIENIKKPFISHEPLIRPVGIVERPIIMSSNSSEQQQQPSEDHFFDDIDFINMLKGVESKKNKSLESKSSSQSIDCFQKNNEIIVNFDTDSFTHFLNASRKEDSNVKSLEDSYSELDLKESYVSL